MNYKYVWDPVGKFFYTANFSLLISGLIVWDSSLIDLIPRVINLELHSILIFLGVLMLLVYFIIDWLDANIVALIDNEVKLKDIIFWLLAPISLSFILTVLLKKGIKFSSWLFLGFNFYCLFSALVLFCRNSLIYEETGNKFFEQKEREKYNRISIIKIFDKLLGVIILLFLFGADIKTGFKIDYIEAYKLVILKIFVIIIMLNTVLKCCRFRYVNYEYYRYMNRDKEKNIH